MSERRASCDERLEVQVTRRTPLHYVGGWTPHVRAASALVRAGGHTWIVQDDTLLVSTIETGPAPRELPMIEGARLYDEARGNKHHKPDLEAAVVLEDAIVGIGSGSTPAREQLAFVPLGAGPAHWIQAPALYAALRGAVPDAALNIEGAFVRGDTLRFLQRGNGRGGINATIDLRLGPLTEMVAHPEVVGVERWDLGALAGVPLTFTDGLALDDTRWWFVATAEASPDTVRDGAVSGSVLGLVDERDGRWAPLRTMDKVEGLAPGEGPGELWAVTDADDPLVPAHLLVLQLAGPWGA